MGINVSTSMGFENRNFLRDTARQILQQNGAKEENANEIVQKISYPVYNSAAEALNSYRAATQITLNKSLKETLKYLQAHAQDRKKQYVLGELWEMLGDYDSEDKYQGELVDFEIDYNLKNIFAA